MNATLYSHKNNSTTVRARRLKGFTSWLLAATLLSLLIPITAAAEMEAYRISPEDVLQISVWKEPDLNASVIVRPDGGITFPLAGDLIAAGKTPQELQGDLTTRIQRYIPDAVVTVSIQELKGLRIYVSGRVKNPGQYQVGRYIDVLQAITLAGGITPYGDEKNIKVIRREAGREVTYNFNYSQVRRGVRLEQNIMLQAGDVVVVP